MIKKINGVKYFFIECGLSKNIAANEKGLAFVGELAFRQPITEAQWLQYC
jgi:hypothetical protein